MSVRSQNLPKHNNIKICEVSSTFVIFLVKLFPRLKNHRFQSLPTENLKGFEVLFRNITVFQFYFQFLQLCLKPVLLSFHHGSDLESCLYASCPLRKLLYHVSKVLLTLPKQKVLYQIPLEPLINFLTDCQCFHSDLVFHLNFTFVECLEVDFDLWLLDFFFIRLLKYWNLIFFVHNC